MQDAADHPPVVHARLARVTVRQVRFDLRPGFIRELEQPCRCPPPALENPNSGIKRKLWQ